MTVIVPMTEEEFVRCPKDDGGGFGAVQTEAGNFPMKAMDVKSSVVGLTATSRVSQTFRNAYTKSLEATYIFPLPPGGAVRNLRIRIADREVVGELKERGQARQEYNEAIAAGHRASIVEEERPDVFTIRVGNVQPGEEMQVTFDVVEPLPIADGEVTFRFPLVVAPRYIPGVPLQGESVGDGTSLDTDAVPDASRITPPVLLPGMPNPVQLSISVSVDGGGFELSNLRSSLHAISETKDGTRTISIQPGERLNRDFILRFDLDTKDLNQQLVLSPDAAGNGGTFAFTIVPEVTSSRAPRDVVFVLDRSGSMGGWKMVAARRAVGRMIDTLTDQDAFSVAAFDTSIDYFQNTESLLDATNRNRFRAIEWLSKIDARGGTEIMEPMTRAVSSVKGGYADRVKIVVLITDGQVGNEREILAAVGKQIGNVRIHTVGIDEAVNTGFLKALSNVGNGVCELVESEDRLDDAMDRIHRNIGRAVFSELSLNFMGMDVEKESLPARMPDVYEGIATVVMGRYENAKSPSVTFRGQDGSGDTIEKTIPGRVHQNDAIGPIWARRHIRDLDDRWNIGLEDKDKLEERLIATSLAFGVLSRFTSFVAVDRAAKVETGDNVQVTQPVEMPHGWAPAQASGGFGGLSRGAVMPGAPMAAAPARPQMVAESRRRTKSKKSLRMESPSPEPMAYEEGRGWSDISLDDEMDMDSSLYEGAADSFAKEEQAETKKGDTYTQAGVMKPLLVGSPEMFRGTENDPETSKVFALGMLLYWAITGEKLFPGNAIQFMAGMVSWDGSSLDASELGGWFNLVSRALEPDPTKRFASVADFAKAMEGVSRCDAKLGDPATLWDHFQTDDVERRTTVLHKVASAPAVSVGSIGLLDPHSIWVGKFGVSFGTPPPKKKKPFWKR